jgi:hypothetical protein
LSVCAVGTTKAVLLQKPGKLNSRKYGPGNEQIRMPQKIGENARMTAMILFKSIDYLPVSR